MSRYAKEVDEVYKARWSGAGKDENERLAFKGEIARELLRARPLEFRDELKAECVRLHEEDIKIYNVHMAGMSDVIPDGEAKTKYVPSHLT